LKTHLFDLHLWNKFINGILVGTGDTGGQNAHYGLSTTKLAILGNSVVLDYQAAFKGIIDDFRVYKGVLSINDIQQLYNEK